jgi:hypothetical protein
MFFTTLPAPTPDGRSAKARLGILTDACTSRSFVRAQVGRDDDALMPRLESTFLHDTENDRLLLDDLTAHFPLFCLAMSPPKKCHSGGWLSRPVV